MEFGQYLKSLRNAKGLSTRDIEADVGLSNSYISQIERGQRTASSEVVRKLSDALNVSYIGMLIKAGHVTEEEVLVYRHSKGIID